MQRRLLRSERILVASPDYVRRMPKLREPEDVSPWNRAVLAFLLALPPGSRIVLYWC